MGVKIALFFEGKLLVFLRDDKLGLRFANMWDFPGGGREGQETPTECIKREVEEEFGIVLDLTQIVWQKEFPAMHDPTLRAYFMVADLAQKDVDSISFGSEGQKYMFMTMDEFMNHENAVPHLKERLRDYLSNQIGSGHL